MTEANNVWYGTTSGLILIISHSAWAIAINV